MTDQGDDIAVRTGFGGNGLESVYVFRHRDPTETADSSAGRKVIESSHLRVSDGWQATGAIHGVPYETIASSTLIGVVAVVEL